MTKLRCALLVLLAVSLSAQSLLTPEEERGRQIYENGTSPTGGAIKASLAGDTQVEASIVPCASCHGHDGLGRPEGGVVPSNITWDTLTKPYGLKSSDGRMRPPYTDRLLKRAIAMGIDSGGNTLDAAMPRFQLSMADASDLVAYMKKLGEAVDPGLSTAAIRLGVILPAPAPDAAMVKQALLDYYDKVNGAGGVFGRRIEPVFMELPHVAALRADAVGDFLRKEHVFAVVGDFSGAEPEIAATMRSTGTPAIAMFAPFPPTGSPLNRLVFYLDGGVEEEEQALLDFAAKQFPGTERRIAIVYSDDDVSLRAAKWLQTRLDDAGRRQVSMHRDEKPVQADIVFWVTTGTAGSPGIVAIRGKTAVLIPGSVSELPASFPSDAQVFVAFGTAMRPTEQIDPARSAWERATASSSLLTEALKTAGRGVSRASLLEALEDFQGVQTNLPVPITFGPDRRIGASGVRILQIDPISRKIETAPVVAQPR